jgi:beta-phosphoglucomutase-like phosphatase (HAD superfamily)
MTTNRIRDLPQPEAVIFDLDGTLVDSVETRIDAWLQTFEEIGVPTSRDELVPLIGLDGKRLAREVSALRGQPIDNERSEVIDKRCGEIYEGLNRDPRALPGVRRLFDTVDARGLKSAIATSSRKEQVKTSVEALGLANEPTIVDASHVEHAKPEPDLLLRAAEELGVDPSRAWYVGDSTWDMVASVAAAMIPLAVTAGSVVSREALEGAGAAVVVDTLDEIADALTPPAGV